MDKKSKLGDKVTMNGSGHTGTVCGYIYGLNMVLSDVTHVVYTCGDEDITDNNLTISSFITSMPTASRTGVFQEADKYTIFAYDAEYYADTEERLQEVMEALLVLYKEG